MRRTAPGLRSRIALLSAALAFASGCLESPTSGTIISEFGTCREGCSRRHKGTDIGNVPRTPIYAACGGRIYRIATEAKAGRLVNIEHPGGLVTKYFHLDDWAPGIHEGMWVAQGQLVGYMGRTGNAIDTTEHLHFEVHAGGVAQDLRGIGLRHGVQLTAGQALLYGCGDAADPPPPPPLPPPLAAVGIAARPAGDGYWVVTNRAKVLTFGGAAFHGDLRSVTLNAPIVGIAATPNGGGYWLVAADGGVFAFGNAPFLGSMGGQPLNQPVVGMAATPNGQGYWLVAADGGIFAFGNAPFLGSMGGQPLNQPVVGMAATPNGGGYWLVAADGGVFAFGNAPFRGSMGGQPLQRPVVGIAATQTGQGYWLTAGDGGVFSFGDADFHGSMGNVRLNAPVMGIARTGPFDGYWLVGADGGVFTFGDDEAIDFHGSAVGKLN